MIIGLASKRARQRASSAVSPRTCAARSGFAAVRSSISSRKASAISGRNSLICQVPRLAASAMSMSFAMTRSPVWMIASGRTGFTLPGMIDEPAWSGAKADLPGKIEEAEVARDLDEVRGVRLEDARHLDEGVGVAPSRR